MKNNINLDELEKEKLKERDTDYDGISDYDEIYYYQTNPYEWDTDDDGISDRKEIALGKNPLERENKSCITERIKNAKQKAAEYNRTFEHIDVKHISTGKENISP